ncbi:putative nonribosomal peptide synthase [Aureobasidium pullulans]|uniref:Nonribosomal peptide synthase n=1 Tax=Aureobasidium pullulans TaxID=5580 RepID=A0AB38LKY4_AURPU|nr:putative nonribosomal peptide synthase [Aureobasidium pullulans]THZ42338.1 putative nonribosomal peptide synthase [Aureobasidium pullulans]
MFGWFSQDSASHAQLDDDVESAFSDLNDPTPQSSDTGLSDHVPLTYLPTLAIESSRRDLPNRLVKSTSIQSITCTGSTKEDQNALVENWARLLHIYTVAEDVAFAVTGLATPRLILSHWPTTSRSLTQDENPRITSTPFDNSKHQAKVNTAIDLGKDYALNQEFDFVLRWSGDHFSDVRLYINHSNVPQKFASAVWSTFAELSAPVKTTDTQRRLKASISRADRRAISSWVPDPIYESQTCLHQLFLDSVHQVPEDNAVEAWDGSLTYAKLNLFSDRVASQLLQKAGGAMVPIDPSQPQARVQEIMNQTNASLVVASASQSVAFAHLFDTVEVSSHTLRNDRPNSDQTNHTLPQMRSGEPALVLFTSGSTGKPKGIVIEHGAIATRTLVEGRAFHYRGARTLQFAATTWDIFMTDVFTTLTYQGCICIPNEQDRRLNLSRFCKDFNVTLALITPTLASILDPAAFPTPQTLIFGGEALQQDVVSKWSFPNGPRIFQGYGPAETGPCVTGRVAERPEILGTPLENSLTGDLLRYSIDTMDGSLEFVGQKDDQVKYHGQRIELKEIEHHLNKIPEVESSTVILVRKGCFKDKLVAVVQCIVHRAQHNTSGSPSIVQDSGFNYSKMRSSLSPRLPDYMIPNELIVVDRLPHTSSMKLDKSHITNWISDMQKSLVERTAEKLVNTSKLLPDEETAMAIAAEYARIVAGDHESRRVSFEGNDFNLQSGGIDSIQIMSLSWYLSRRYAVQIPIADMLSSKATVRTLASTIDAKRGSQVAQKRSTPLGVLNEVSQQLDRLELGEIPHYENSEVQRVFVTGSSGFLGIEILRQLLTLSGCHVYALVRGPSREGARNRLIARARAVGWWQEVFSARPDVWTGDLTKPQIGLTDGQWAMLQAQTTPSIDAIIHNGAKVHYNMDYESLKTTNVSSTVELLKAVRSRQRPLYSFVFVSGGQELRFDDQETTKAVNQSGYARSKVVSELIVKKFARQQDSKARHVRVIKPGFIIGDSKQGLANQTDFLWRLVAASIDLGFYNESDSENWLFVADVARVLTSILDGIFEDHGKPVTQVLDGIRFRDLTQWYMSSIPIELGRNDPESIKKTERLGNNYKELAAFMNADADEIAFGQTTTSLFRALGQALRPLLDSDCEMVVSNLCHEASAAAWIALAKDLNIAIKWWAPPPGDDPCLSLETLKPLLTAKTRIVTCNHVSNVVGTCHPIRQVADMVHQIPGAILIVDGVAWAPHRPIDVKALDVDFYCFSWYKVFGPHIAQLYGRRSTQKRVLAGISHYFLSDMPGLDWRLRLGTNTFELEEALVPIAHYLQHEVGWEKIIAQEVVLQETLLNYLRRRPQHFRIFGEKSSDPEKRVSVITFEVIGRSCNDMTNQICRKGRFRVVSGNCWAPRPTHDVLKLGPDGLIRVSFVHYNTVAEVHEFCQELDSIVKTCDVINTTE